MRFDPEQTRDGEYVDADFGGTRFRNVNFQGARLMEAMLLNARISGLVTGLVINDVEIEPLLQAEMNRRYPERARLRPNDADGVRETWSFLETMWATTMRRADSLPDALLRRRVENEWSFLETLRHLIFVTDLWLGRSALGRAGHFHPLGMPPSFMTDHAAFGVDTSLVADSAQVVAVRNERLEMVGRFIADVTDARLDDSSGEHTIRECLHTLFNEEWHHHLYATRDLDSLGPSH